MEIDMDPIKLKSKPAPFFRMEDLSKVNVTNQIEADPYAQTERSTTSTSTNQSTTKPPPSTTTFPATNPPPKKTATTAMTPRPTITPPAVTRPPVVIPSYVQSISKAKSLDPIELHITTITTPTTTPATQPRITTTPVRTTTVRPTTKITAPSYTITTTTSTTTAPTTPTTTASRNVPSPAPTTTTLRTVPSTTPFITSTKSTITIPASMATVLQTIPTPIKPIISYEKLIPLPPSVYNNLPPHRHIKRTNNLLTSPTSDDHFDPITIRRFVLSKDGIKPNPEKTKAIDDYPTPKNPTEIKAFLGMCSFFRRFVHNFAAIAAPLTGLTKKDTPFIWTIECENAMKRLKEALTTAPILVAPRLGLPFVIETDSSGKAVAGVLKQEQDNDLKVIAYASRTLNVHESRYPAIELEALGVVFAVQKFRPYIDGAKCTVITDHAPLKALLHRKDLTGRLAKYQIILQEFDITIMYRPGKANVVCDTLSRHPPQVNAVPTESNNNIDLSSPDIMDKIREEQNKTPWIASYKQAIEQNEPNPYTRDYILLNEILYKLPEKMPSSLNNDDSKLSERKRSHSSSSEASQEDNDRSPSPAWSISSVMERRDRLTTQWIRNPSPPL
ncbi:unnamed protein product [Cylicocyclus nassatus]|uniref:RNA-directed DNA polymerase n=1 Tax=Cylicocyclus nassatus TaxID=53992 RepID=A0AA36GWF3_CYLNA|nr:unnamed protein product [Cylicocyclus nassatus]